VRSVAAARHGREKGRLARVQIRSVGERARRDDPGDFAFDDALGFARVFDLIADGDAVTLANQPAEIRVEGVVRHAAHRNGGAVGLWIDGQSHVQTGDAGRTHAERLPAELLDLLQRHGRSLSDVNLLAVVAGPGSFTGLRVGMAAVQGLAIVRHLQVVPVPTLEAMADAWLDAEPGSEAALRGAAL